MPFARQLLSWADWSQNSKYYIPLADVLQKNKCLEMEYLGERNPHSIQQWIVEVFPLVGRAMQKFKKIALVRSILIFKLTCLFS